MSTKTSVAVFLSCGLAAIAVTLAGADWFFAGFCFGFATTSFSTLRPRRDVP